MLKRKMIFFSLFLTPFLSFWIFQMIWMKPSDLERYKTLIRKRELASSCAKSPANQHRKGVCKDIWFSQDDQSRLHYEIYSDSSLLTLTPVGNRLEIVESLEGIQCWMQDKLITDETTFSESQQARLIEAQSGVYRHTAQQFVATEVNLSLFELPGHTLPKQSISKEEAFLRGIAHDVSFLFSGKTPQFQANQFEAMVVKE